MSSREASESPTWDPESEALLLAELRAGKQEAYERLVRAYAGRLLAVARRYLASEEDAQDAVQEAFLNAFRALPRFQGDARLSTWLHRIVVNAALMKLRSRRRKPEEPIDELLPSYLEDGHRADRPSPWKESAEAAALRGEVRAQVHAAIARLPESYRTVLLLRDIDELSTEEVARELGITPQAVKTRLHRARQALRTLLDPVMRKDAP